MYLIYVYIHMYIIYLIAISKYRYILQNMKMEKLKLFSKEKL